MEMATLAILSTVVGTATQVVGQGMAAREQGRAAAFEGQQHRIQEQQLRTAALQDEANRREELNSSIGTVLAFRAGRGVGLSSPTGNAILTDLTDEAEGNISVSRANILTKADQSRMASDMLRRKSRMAMLSGGIGAVGTIAGAGFKLSQTKFPL